MDILTLLSNYAFPIVCCVAMGFYVKYSTDCYRSDVKELQKEHKEEIAKITEALNNNTLALQKLCDKMDAERVVTNDK